MKPVCHELHARCGLRAVVAAAAIASSAAANVTNTIPYTASFETNVVDTSLVGSGGWYGQTPTALMVRAASYTYPLRLPLAGATHNKIVQFSLASTNAFNHAGGDTNIWFDLMVKPVFIPYSPIVNDDVQFALCFNTNGNLRVYHGYYDQAYTLSKRWTTLAHPSLPSGKWARVTLKMDYYSGDMIFDNPGANMDKFFQIHLNGGAALTNEFAYDHIPWDMGNDVPPAGGTWFLLANSGFGAGPTNVSSLAIKGTGFMDDLAVLKTDPLTTTGTNWTITATAGPGGTIYPGGTFHIPQGTSVTFSVYASAGRGIDDVLVDGASVGPTNSYTFTSVATNHTIAAQFSTAYTTKGVYHWWMDSYGLFNYETDQWLDSDGDGATNWQEYVAGTIPTDSNSVFHVTDVAYMGASNRVTWYSTLNGDTTVPYFHMWRSTNLTLGGWSLISTNTILRGTNTWWDTNVPVGVPSYYRPTIPWDY